MFLACPIPFDVSICAERSEELLLLFELHVFEEHSPFPEITPHMHMYCVYKYRS